MQRWPKLLNGVDVPYGEPVTTLDEYIAEGSAEQRWASFIALAEHGTSESLGSLQRHAGSSNAHERRAALEAIGEHALGLQLAELVRGGLRDRSQTVVRAACVAAARLRVKSAHDALLQLAVSALPPTQLVALRSLVELWRPEDAAAVLRVFRSTQAEDVRREAGWSLFKTADAHGWRELFGLWHGDELSRHRRWACVLAEKFGADEVREELIGLVRDADGHVRKAATKALAHA